MHQEIQNFADSYCTYTIEKRLISCTQDNTYAISDLPQNSRLRAEVDKYIAGSNDIFNALSPCDMCSCFKYLTTTSADLQKKISFLDAMLRQNKKNTVVFDSATIVTVIGLFAESDLETVLDALKKSTFGGRRHRRVKKTSKRKNRKSRKGSRKVRRIHLHQLE